MRFSPWNNPLGLLCVIVTLFYFPTKNNSKFISFSLTRYPLSFTTTTNNKFPRQRVSRIAEKLIFDHQNPKSCNNKQFFVLDCHFCGLGCIVHHLSDLLLHSLNHSRILVTGSNCGSHLTEGMTCINKDYSCFFLPLSSCGLPDITPENSEVFSYRTMSILRPQTPTFERFRTLATPSTNLFLFSRVFCVAYVMRFQPGIWSRVRQSLSDSSTVTITPRGKPVRGNLERKKLAASIALYVRHGNKYLEMTLLNYSSYVAAALALSQKLPYLSNSIFLVTDDTNVILEAESLLPANWSLSYTSMLRTNNDPLLNEGKNELLRANSSASEIFISQLIQIVYMVYAGAGVGTLQSNLCAIVYELRCAWLPPHGSTYVNLFIDKRFTSVQSHIIGCPGG